MNNSLNCFKYFQTTHNYNINIVYSLPENTQNN